MRRHRGPGNSFPIGLEAFPVQVPVYCSHEEFVSLLVGPFLSTVMLLQIVCDGFAVFDLVKEQSFQNTDFGHLGNTSHNLIPVTDEPTQVVTLELHAKPVLKGICRTMLNVGTEVLMHHQQHLATPYIPFVCSFSFFIGVYVPSEVTRPDVGEC